MKKISLFIALSFLLIVTACDGVEKGEQHAEVEGVRLMNGTSNVVTIRQGVVTGSLTVQVGQTGAQLKAVYMDANGNDVAATTFEAGTTTGTTWGDATIAETVVHDAWSFHVKGKKVGATTLKLDLLHNGHSDFTTPLIPVTVTPSTTK